MCLLGFGHLTAADPDAVVSGGKETLVIEGDGLTHTHKMKAAGAQLDLVICSAPAIERRAAAG